MSRCHRQGNANRTCIGGALGWLVATGAFGTIPWAGSFAAAGPIATVLAACIFQTGTEAFQILGEVGLSEPDPNPLIEFWLYDHPSISERMAFVQQYDPWSRNETEYIH